VITALAQTVNATSASLLSAVTPFMGSIILLLIGTIAPFVVIAVIELLHYIKVTSAIRDTTTVGVPERTEHGYYGHNVSSGNGYNAACAWQ